MFRLKKAVIVALALLLVLGSGILGYRHLVPVEVFSFHVMLFPIYTLEEMEEWATVIVEVTIIGKGIPNPRERIMGEPGWFPETATPARVEKVYKGDVSPGDIIPIHECYVYERRFDGIYLWTIEDYVPMKKGSRYLLFLTGEPEYLGIVSVFVGKFVWPPPETRSNSNLEISHVRRPYGSIFQEVVAKYHQSD